MTTTGGTADAGTIGVGLVLRDKRFIASVKASEARFNKTSARLGSIGRKLTTRVTVPLLAIGAALTVTAAKFDQEMTKIVTLVGVAENQVDSWRRSLLGIAPAVGVGPQQLSEALFVVTSAGERTANALKIVESSAKASAIGLGATKDVARAVTSAMQAYKVEGLSAAQATDILVATVREGNLEASELAGSLGRVLGVAAALKVSFADVGTFIATFTRLGVSAAESVTALRSLLATILRPTEGAREALGKFGITAAGLREQLGTRGLAGTLIALVNTLSSDEEALTTVIPNVRALAGILGTAGAQGESFVRISKSIANSAGLLEKGFKRVKETPAQQFKEFVAEMKVVAIEAGNELIPALSDLLKSLQPIIGEVKKAISVFSKLTPGQQKSRLAIVGLVVALGPLTSGLSLVTKTMGLSVTAARALATNWNTVVGGLAGGLGPILAAVVALKVFNKAMDKAEQEIEDATAAVIRADSAYGTWRDRIIALKEADPAAFRKFKQRVDELRAAGNETINAWIKAWGEMGKSTTTAANVVDQDTDQIDKDLEELRGNLEDLLGPLGTGFDLNIEDMIADELQGFDNALAAAQKNLELFGNNFNIAEAQADIFRQTIDNLIGLGVDLDAQLGDTGLSLRDLAEWWKTLNETVEQNERATEAALKVIARIQFGITGKISFVGAKSKVKKEVEDIGDEAAEKMKTVGIGAGRALISGMIRGIDDMSSLLENAIFSIIETVIIGNIESMLKIDSPSKVAVGWGRSIVEGFKIGLADGSANFARSVGLSKFSSPGFASSVGGIGGATIVHQRNTVEIIAMDSRDVERALIENKSLLAGIFTESVEGNEQIRQLVMRR